MLFSRYLRPGLLSVSNWFFNIAGAGRHATSPTAASARHVRGPTGTGVLIGDPDTVTFDPPPFDVVASDGTLAPSFQNFPLTFV